MSNRVTIKQLQSVVDRLNRLTSSPMEAYVKDSEGRYIAQVGNWHLSQAYGGVCLHRMHNTGGGVSSPFQTGHISKRDLQDLLHAYIAGIQTQQETAQ